MSSLLIRNATVMVTMDGERREIHNGGFFAQDGWIRQVGTTPELPSIADVVLDMSDHVVLPGLVNTHHHLFQTLTRAVPGAQDASLFGWLKTLFPIWAKITPQDVRVSTQVGLLELALTGCTTACDHMYLFHNGCRLDDQIEVAKEVGIRFHACRGSMNLGESKGGLPPDRIVEADDVILKDTQRVIETYHDSKPGAMTRILVGPTSSATTTKDLIRESAALARSCGVRLHMHLAETLDEEKFCLESFGCRPLDYAEEVDMIGSDVSFAHAVRINLEEIIRMARAGCTVAHCPSANMRLASGIAPIFQYLRAGVKVGLGVDGSASNDSSHMLAEVRQALLVSRLRTALERENTSAEFLRARQVLEMATLGGAAVLGREDIGALESGKTADFIAIDLNRLEYAGALHDPVAALVFCAPVRVDYNYVHGRAIVHRGRLVTLDIPSLIGAHNAAARRLIEGV